MGRLDDLKRAMIRGALDGLEASITDLETRSFQLAPIDEGTLRASRTIVYLVNGQPFEGDGAKDRALAAAIAAVQAGGDIDLRAELAYVTPYAAAIHEGIAFGVRGGNPYVWQVRNHPKGGQEKYLETPLLEMAPRYQRVIGAATEREVRRLA